MVRRGTTPQIAKKLLAVNETLYAPGGKLAAEAIQLSGVGDNRSMTAAVFGLIGVIVGVVLNALVAYTLEKQREKRAVRAAARLLLDPFAVDRRRA